MQSDNHHLDPDPISRLVGHPELLNGDTLYALRTVVARYPYFQTARLLLLRNLYLLHEPDFGRELRRSVFYVVDRRAIWQFVQGIAQTTESIAPSVTNTPLDALETVESTDAEPTFDRTAALIDAFLDTLPEQSPTLIPDSPATTDYMALLASLQATDDTSEPSAAPLSIDSNPLESLEPIESIKKTECPTATFAPASEASETALETEFLTETLARIYIKQKKYERALEIIRSLYLNYPEKSIYFADQIRFLEKLIRNNNLKKIN